ncbi:uncharacterized protein RAG0_17077 [Rhynchosporium agropyri]|uniref:Uncharacterized protein n=1 Tax=Rhynchosporium agropyri TaxID=914238 RepID=A0A1E1LUJ7_9HELO|nr:uncharacterized protein RAG0_17077 [Rhynchosporium agropyri]
MQFNVITALLVTMAAGAFAVPAQAVEAKIEARGAPCRAQGLDNGCGKNVMCGCTNVAGTTFCQCP